jgi:pimeloyl-ACP methyl ester carboxylesterase
MSPSLLTIFTDDQLQLPGLLYEPDNSKKVALFLHGMGSTSVFYKHEQHTERAKALAEHGIAYCAFNNRGAHYIKKLKRTDGESFMYGMAFETIREAVLDIQSALAELSRLGYEEFYLIGHSTGANKICVYDSYTEENPVSGYVLWAGGDDTGLFYEQFGEHQFHTVLDMCRREIEAGRGTEYVPLDIMPQPYSYAALYDLMNPDGDYNTFPFFAEFQGYTLGDKPKFREWHGVTVPSLVVYGEEDEFFQGRAGEAVSALQRYAHPESEHSYELVPEADHSFRHHQEELNASIASFLKQLTR